MDLSRMSLRTEVMDGRRSSARLLCTPTPSYAETDSDDDPNAHLGDQWRRKKRTKHRGGQKKSTAKGPCPTPSLISRRTTRPSSRGFHFEAQHQGDNFSGMRSPIPPPNLPQNQPFNLPQNQPPNLPQNQTPNLPQNQTPNLPQNQTPNLPQNLPPNLPQNQTPNLPQNQPPNLPQNQPPNLPQNEPEDLSVPQSGPPRTQNTANNVRTNNAAQITSPEPEAESIGTYWPIFESIRHLGSQIENQPQLYQDGIPHLRKFLEVIGNHHNNVWLPSIVGQTVTNTAAAAASTRLNQDG